MWRIDCKDEDMTWEIDNHDKKWAISNVQCDTTIPQANAHKTVVNSTGIGACYMVSLSSGDFFYCPSRRCLLTGSVGCFAVSDFNEAVWHGSSTTVVIAMLFTSTASLTSLSTWTPWHTDTGVRHSAVLVFARTFNKIMFD